MRLARRESTTVFAEITMTRAFGSKPIGANEDILAVQLDSPQRLEAVSRHLIKCGLRMTENGKFADFAIVHGIHGLSADCNWLHFVRTADGGEVSYRRDSHYLEGLDQFAVEGQAAEWIDQIGHGFVLDSSRWLRRPDRLQ